MEINDQIGEPSRKCGDGWGKNAVHVGIVFEHGLEPRFDNDRHLQVGSCFLQNLERRRGQHRIAERPQTDHGDASTGRQTLQYRRHRGKLLFDFRFVNEHHGDVVANRIHPVALFTLQAGLVMNQVNRGLAERADKNVQQVLTDGHSLVSL